MVQIAITRAQPTRTFTAVTGSEPRATIPACVRNEIRPLLPGEGARFLNRSATGPAVPQLRLRGALAGVSAPSPATLAQLTLKAEQVVDIAADLSVDVEALLAAGTVPINLSDLDGTFWKQTITETVLRMALERDALRPEAHSRVLSLLAELNVEPSGAGVNEDTRRLLAACLRRLKDPEKHAETIELLTRLGSWIYAGNRIEDIEALAREAIETRGLGDSVFEGALEMVTALESAGVPTAFFSASPEFLVKPACAALGIDPNMVCGTQVETVDGVLTDRIVEPLNHGEGKATHARAFLRRWVASRYPGVTIDEPRPLLSAGDKPATIDSHLLALGRVALVVEPGSTREVEGALELAAERNNVFVLDFANTRGGQPADRFVFEPPPISADRRELHRRARALYQGIATAFPATADVEYTVRLFSDPDVSSFNDVRTKTEAVLEANRHSTLPGYLGGIETSDEGFKAKYRDSPLHGAPSKQPAHFLTALAAGFRGFPRSMLAKLRCIVPSALLMSDEDCVLHLIVGHEMAGDPPESQRSRGGRFLRKCATTLNFARIIRAQFLAAKENDAVARFDEALTLLGEDGSNVEAAERHLREHIRVDENLLGCSYADLYLTLIGYWLGQAIRSGKLTTNREVARYIRRTLAD